MDKEVMGIGDNIKVWRDHRGIFYYVDNNGKPTQEPVHLSREQCSGRPQRNTYGVFGIGIALIGLTGFTSDNSDKKAAIEMQCKTRQKWESQSRYRNRYRR